jgi:predicted dehydrogenase
MVDFDTSHVVEFSKRINHVGVDSEQWVEGARVILGYPGTSEITPEEKVRQYTEECRDRCGVTLAERPEDLLGQVDGVFIESQCGAVHLERARPFLQAKIPVFIDKPFTNSVADAKEIARLAVEHRSPVFSASSLRYALEVQELLRRTPREEVLSVDVLTPGATHVKNPGLLHYGIHGVEMLYTLLGPGCERVSCHSGSAGQVAVGTWKDGRIGTVRAVTRGASTFAFTACTDKEVVSQTVNTSWIYRELLQRILKMMEIGESPLDLRETVEIIAFIQAARESDEQGGSPVELAPME